MVLFTKTILDNTERGLCSSMDWMWLREEEKCNAQLIETWRLGFALEILIRKKTNFEQFQHHTYHVHNHVHIKNTPYNILQSDKSKEDQEMITNKSEIGR